MSDPELSSQIRSLEEVLDPETLQEMADNFSELAGVDLFFAHPSGRLLTSLSKPEMACARMTSDPVRTCRQCRRHQLDPRGLDWPDADVALIHACPSGKREILLPVRLNGRVIGVLGSVQVDIAQEPQGNVVRANPRGNVTEANPRDDVVQAVPRDRLPRVQRLASSLVGILTRMAALAQEESRLRARYESMARTDHLTGLENRRQAVEALRGQFALAARRGPEFGVLLLDVDHFKRINDTLGHNAGDDVLRELAQVLRANLRPYDHAFRYGGEEFLVLCPSTDEEELGLVGNRLLQRIADHSFPVEQLPQVTVSIGGACGLKLSTPSPEDLLQQADLALYQAKRSGRNRFILGALSQTA